MSDVKQSLNVYTQLLNYKTLIEKSNFVISKSLRKKFVISYKRHRKKVLITTQINDIILTQLLKKTNLLNF